MRSAALVVLFLALAGPALAEPVFPRGAAVGLEPPPGLRPAERFAGFEDPASGASILIAEFPPLAYAEMRRAMAGTGVKRTGLKAAARQELELRDGPALLIRGRQTVQGKAFRKWILLVGAAPATAMVTVQAPVGTEKALSDKVVEMALRSVVVRTPAGPDEALDALPFRIGDLAGLRVMGILAGSAVALTEGPLDQISEAGQPVVIVASSVGETPPEASRIAFAETALKGIPGVLDVRIEGKPEGSGDIVRLTAAARDDPSGRPLRLVQVIRFGPKGYLRTVGVARADTAGFGDRVARVSASLAWR